MARRSARPVTKPDHCHGARVYPAASRLLLPFGLRSARAAGVYDSGVSSAPLALTIPVALLFAVLAAASAVMAKKGFAGALTRQGKLGVHTPAAMASDEAFALANRVAAPVAGGAAVVAGVLAVAVLALPLSTATALVMAVVGLAGTMALLVVAGVLGDRSARQVPIPAAKPVAGSGCTGCACGSGGCAGITRSDPAAAAGQA